MNYKIKELNIKTRPRERLKELGAECLGDDELLAILLRTGTKEINAKELAQNIINHIGGIKNFSNTSLNDLAQIKGVGEVKGITILAALELGKRFLKVDDTKIQIKNTRVVYDLFKYDFRNACQENFIALYLDVKNNLISYETLFKGTVSSSTIHPREIFKSAMKYSASKIIVVHNHPSGSSCPSLADEDLTTRLIEIGNLVSIPVIDHIIIGHNNFYSFMDKKRVDIDE
jgi:DNA repair protein RadC